MAGPASTLDIPLHTHLGVLAQSRRRLLRQAHQATPQAWRVPVCCRPAGRHQLLRHRDKLRSKTFRLDRQSQTHPRRCQTREEKVRVDPLFPTRASAANDQKKIVSLLCLRKQTSERTCPRRLSANYFRFQPIRLRARRFVATDKFLRISLESVREHQAGLQNFSEHEAD